MSLKSVIRRIFGISIKIEQDNIDRDKHYVELFKKWYPDNKIKSVYNYTSLLDRQQHIYFVFDEEISEDDYELITSELTIEIVASFTSSIQPSDWTEYYLYTSDDGSASSDYLRSANYVCGRKVPESEKLKLYKKI